MAAVIQPTAVQMNSFSPADAEPVLWRAPRLVEGQTLPWVVSAPIGLVRHHSVKKIPVFHGLVPVESHLLTTGWQPLTWRNHIPVKPNAPWNAAAKNCANNAKPDGGGGMHNGFMTSQVHFNPIGSMGEVSGGLPGTTVRKVEYIWIGKLVGFWTYSKTNM